MHGVYEAVANFKLRDEQRLALEPNQFANVADEQLEKARFA